MNEAKLTNLSKTEWMADRRENVNYRSELTLAITELIKRNRKRENGGGGREMRHTDRVCEQFVSTFLMNGVNHSERLGEKGERNIKVRRGNRK